MPSLLRSSSLRLAAAYAVAVALTTYTVSILVFWAFYRDNMTVVESVLTNEVKQSQSLTNERLKARLQLRLTQDIRHLDFVGLYDMRGALIFGNTAQHLDLPVDGKPQERSVKPPTGSGAAATTIFVAAPVKEDAILVLGRSLSSVDLLKSEMQAIFAATVAPLILLSFAAGVWVSLQSSRRLMRIRRAITDVMNGDFSVRLPSRGKPDDVDDLVGAVNSMLDRIDHLVHQIKSVGDNIAHDLRAPLAVVRARLDRGQAIGTSAALMEASRRSLEDIDRAIATVTALLRISELEINLRRSAFEAVDLRDVGEAAFSLYDALAEAKNIHLVFEAQGPIPITGDADLLRDAVANIVDNAIKFTPQGGKVSIACGTHGALLRVTDTGPGVQENERQAIFERLYRSETARGLPGAGLGLSMVAAIASLHGLSVRVRDNNPGAIFEIVRNPDQP